MHTNALKKKIWLNFKDILAIILLYRFGILSTDGTIHATVQTV